MQGPEAETKIWLVAVHLFIRLLDWNKFGIFSLLYFDIPKMFFMPHRVGHCCTNMIQDLLCNSVS
jgi:hypothetical protein